MNTNGHPFDEIVQLPDERIRLASAALLFARDEYPDLKLPHYVGLLDTSVHRLARTGARAPEDQIDALRDEIVEHLGLTGNRDDYQNHENSYLNRVLDRRSGIPVTLSAVWLDVAGCLGWPFVGVNMPGHFLIAVAVPGRELYVDPFHDGECLCLDAVRRRAYDMFGPGFELEPAHLAPVGVRQILFRMLGNLRSCYVAAQDWPRAARVLQRMHALRPGDVAVAGELAQALARTGQCGAALAILHNLLRANLPDKHEKFVGRQMQALLGYIARQN